MGALKNMLENCDSCGEVLEIGQIGLCDDCQATGEEQDEDSTEQVGNSA